MKVIFGKTSEMINGAITEHCSFELSKVDTFGICCLRVKSNSVLYLKFGEGFILFIVD